ncbi:MAG: alanine racemase [Opitutae bacterium]|nr:alanine racemase [Opitutae bacterium]
MSSVYPPRPALSLELLSTPCLVLEREKLARNLARMAATVAARGVHLRPHLKTAKCAEIAHLAAPDRAPITVSTLREAEYFAHHGWTDIFYAVGFGPGKLARAAGLLRAGVRLVTMVDHPDTAAALAEFAQREKLTFRTVIEIDSGDHRGGVTPSSALLLTIARALGRHFAGVATHGGQSYAARSPQEIAAVAQTEVECVRIAATRLHMDGFPSEIVSVGSSPTALAAGLDLTGVTEVRAGVYMFWDLFQAGLGVCTVDDIAVTVLAEVIGRPADRPNEFLIDAGSFALSKDTATAALPPEKNAGYGWLCDLDGRHLPGLRVARTWQEHGLVVSDAPLPAGSFPIGSRVRVLPNHACPTAAAHDRYFVTTGDRGIVAEWPRVNGW